MLETLVTWSVKRRGVVIVVWGILAAVAVGVLPHMSIDAVPDVTNVQVSVITSAPGLSPAEVEQYLTYPVETSMNGLPGVTEIRSVSRTAVSAVTIVFDDGTDIWFARQLVNERLKNAEMDIPPGYGRPELAPVSTGLGEIYEFYLVSTKHTPMELRTLMDWVVAYKLRSVPGVIEVNAMGGQARQFQVTLSPRKLAAYRLTLKGIENALQRNNASIGAGYIEKNSESFVIRAASQFRSVVEIGNTVVASDDTGTPVLLKQIADVSEGPALRFGSVTKSGEGPIVAGTVMMLIGANSRDVVTRVKARLDEIRKELPEGVEIRSYYDRAEFIDRMLETVTVNLAEGAALVILVLFFTLGSLRAALIASLAIPLSMGIAVMGMVYLKVTGNLMSLGAIDFGLLVDGAIVMLELALTNLAQKHLTRREDLAEAVADSMRQAARPVTFALLIILMVYLPLMFLQGVEGRMFRPMAMTIALALAGALAFSLTAVPALSAYVLTSPKHAHDENRGFFGRLRRSYDRALGYVFAHPRLVLSVAGLGLAGSMALATTLGAEFVPRLDEGELSLDIKRLPSISLTEAERLGVQVEKVLAGFPEVLSIVTRTGRAEVATDPVGPDEAEVMVKLRPHHAWTTAHDLDTLGEKIKQAVEDNVPATFVAVSQPIEDRVNQLLAGSRADVVIKVFGDDLSVLKNTADQIGRVVRDVPGCGDWRVQRVLGLPLLEITPDRLRLARYGIASEDILEVVEASRVGRNVGKIFEGSRRFDLVLLMPPPALTPEGFGELFVGTDKGGLIPMAEVADIRQTEGPAVINRESLQRRVLVEVNVRGRDLVSYVADAQARVAQMTLPAGVHVEWGGQFENFSRARDRLLLVVPMALALIFSMLFFMFGNGREALAVFAGAPFALIGGVLALWLRGLPFSIPAAVGFIAVAGVAVLNGVVMGHEVRSRTLKREPDALRRAALTVLRPIVTTALVAAIGFMPMALSTRAGAEVQRPLATVVVGGIMSSTLLSLVVLPLLLRALRRRDPDEASPI